MCLNCLSPILHHNADLEPILILQWFDIIFDALCQSMSLECKGVGDKME